MMATIGVLVPPSPGHLNPMNTLGRELAGRGHRVVVPQLPEVEPAVLAAGLEFVPIRSPDFPAGEIDRQFARLGELNGRSAMKFSVASAVRVSQLLLRETPEVFRSTGADLLLVDQ